jgi:ATP-dependent DNA ligase
MEKRIPISSVLAAIESDVIKGDFLENFKEFSFNTVKTTNQAGEESSWTIKVVAFDTEKDKIVRFKRTMIECPVTPVPANIIGRYYVENRTHTGHIRKAEATDVLVGKNLGKKNATTSVGQAILIANTLYQLKLNKSAKEGKVERPLPMLVKKEGVSKGATLSAADFENGILIEPKLDGIRMIAHVTPSNNIELYSRTAKAFNGLENIERDTTNMLFKQNIYRPEQIYLDGEIYLHGKQLQSISGAVRGSSENSGDVERSKLKYFIFDCFLPSIPNMPQAERKELLDKLFASGEYPSLVLVKGRVAHSDEEVKAIYNDYLKGGYEGAIARRLHRKYEPSKNNYHTDALLKIKPFLDAEYQITDYTQGSGKDKGAVIFKLKTDTGKTFVAVPNMTYDRRKELFSQFKTDPESFNQNYLNKMGTVQYSSISKLGVPQQPKFITIREFYE